MNSFTNGAPYCLAVVRGGTVLLSLHFPLTIPRHIKPPARGERRVDQADGVRVPAVRPVPPPCRAPSPGRASTGLRHPGLAARPSKSNQQANGIKVPSDEPEPRFRGGSSAFVSLYCCSERRREKKKKKKKKNPHQQTPAFAAGFMVRLSALVAQGRQRKRQSPKDCVGEKTKRKETPAEGKQ